MPNILFIDEETTGLPNYNLRARDPSQPHIVRFASQFFCDEKLVEEKDMIVKPNGWQIPQETIDIHGVTNEIAQEKGVPEIDVTRYGFQLIKEAHYFVAFNRTFDKFILRCAGRRYGIMQDGDDQWWKDKPGFCVMREMVGICCLPKSNGYGFKFPRLTEAYRHAFKEDLVRAHSALDDCRATSRLFFWLKQAGYIKIS